MIVCISSGAWIFLVTKIKALKVNNVVAAFILFYLLLVRQIIGSIPHVGPIELLLILATGITKTMVCAILCEIMHIKEPLLLNGKSNSCNSGSDFLLSLSGSLPYVWRHITVNKTGLIASLNKTIPSFP